MNLQMETRERYDLIWCFFGIAKRASLIFEENHQTKQMKTLIQTTLVKLPLPKFDYQQHILVEKLNEYD